MTPQVCWPGRLILLAASLLAVLACSSEPQGQDPVTDDNGITKTAPDLRADRRLFDGAPPVIPHPPFGAACIACHHREGVAVPDVGFAPPSPHSPEALAGALQRCQQCHVFQETDPPFVDNSFVGLRQDLRLGRRLYDGAPPVIPHRVFMRENCSACHSGAAAREAIRTSHPERANCQQCHVEQTTTARFDSTNG